jgi:hypothetical protein
MHYFSLPGNVVCAGVVGTPALHYLRCIHNHGNFIPSGGEETLCSSPPLGF